jgi:nicotinamide mononucleotide (NMN) deamidase PncC
VGTVYIAIADEAGVYTEHRRFLGDRQRIRLFTVHLALDLLRRRLTGICG